MNEKQAFEPGPNNDYAPNPVQQEFLRLAGLRYWYLALGETNHTIPHINAFMSHTKTVAAVTDGRRKNIFLEIPMRHQDYLNALKASGRFGSVTSSLKSRWLGRRVNEQLSDIFERAVQDNFNARFIAADARNVRIMFAKGFLPLALGLGVHVASHLLSKPVGVVSERARFRLRETLLRLMGSSFLCRLVVRAASDDRNTVRFIKTFEGPAVLNFGATHLMGGFDEDSARRSMRTLLPEGDRALCVMNVYNTIEERNEHRTLIAEKFPGARLPDADLLVKIAGEDCYGIRLNNPALQPLFNEAVRNVVLRMANPPVPASPKGGGGYFQVKRGPDA